MRIVVSTVRSGKLAPPPMGNPGSATVLCAVTVALFKGHIYYTFILAYYLTLTVTHSIYGISNISTWPSNEQQITKYLI